MNNKLGFQISAFWASIFFFAFSIGGNYSNPGEVLVWINISSVLSAVFCNAWLAMKFVPSEKCQDDVIFTGLMIMLVILFVGCGIFIVSFSSNLIGEALNELKPGEVYSEFVAHSRSLIKGLGAVKDAAQSGDPEQLSGIGQHFHWILAAIGVIAISLPLVWSSIPDWMLKGTKRMFWTTVGAVIAFFVIWGILAIGNFTFYIEGMKWTGENDNITTVTLLAILTLINVFAFFRCKPATDNS